MGALETNLPVVTVTQENDPQPSSPAIPLPPTEFLAHLPIGARALARHSLLRTKSTPSATVCPSSHTTGLFWKSLLFPLTV